MLPQVAQQVLENKERENEIQSLVHELRNKEVCSQTVLVPTFLRSLNYFSLTCCLVELIHTINLSLFRSRVSSIAYPEYQISPGG